jgi:hypothetical protein
MPGSNTIDIRPRASSISLRPEPMNAIELGDVLVKSGFFADSKDAAQAAVKVMAGAELGFGPIASMTGIHIIKNKVSLSANLMAAAIKRHPRYDFRVHDGHPTDTECAIDFFEDGRQVGTSTFTMDDAKKANLTGGNYSLYPRNMLFSRALSNGAKWHCPDVTSGVATYVPEDFGEQDAIDGALTFDQMVEPVARAARYGPAATDELRVKAAAALGEIFAGAVEGEKFFELLTKTFDTQELPEVAARTILGLHFWVGSPQQVTPEEEAK